MPRICLTSFCYGMYSLTLNSGLLMVQIHRHTSEIIWETSSRCESFFSHTGLSGARLWAKMCQRSVMITHSLYVTRNDVLSRLSFAKS